MEFKSFINRDLQLPNTRFLTFRIDEMLSPRPILENNLILQSSKCNWVLDMQMFYVMFIWRKIQLRNMGVISLSPMQAGDIGGCEVVKKLGGFKRVWGQKKE